MSHTITMTTPLYGGEVQSADAALRLPFVLRDEVVDAGTHRVITASAARTTPQCQHFMRCGGCQYQMQRYDAQAEDKRSILRGLLVDAGVKTVPAEIAILAGEPYGYRNRIRLRVQRVDGELRFGYNVRATTQFLPINECPIAAPLLWQIAETLLQISETNIDAAAWLDAANEVELFTNDALDKVQMTLLCPPRTKQAQGSFARMMNAVHEAAPAIIGAGAIAVDAKIGPTGKVFEAWGADGLQYHVGEETYWVSRGGFFQVNRFLLPQFVKLVTDGLSGNIAWDLFAGVGLFSRVLAKSFAQVTAVEASPLAAQDLAATMKKLGKQHRAVAATTLDFLKRAKLERERAEVVVLDPPRAGVGEEACTLLAAMKPREIVYVSCDPTTLARDWRVLEVHGYTATSAHLVDLFPQTFHMETVVRFTRA
ncbi:class I SAM-dependent RNA methyltransferase [Granulicella cerasi]|uniref:Class I SAM-dependent RNA methyltransferase n=1 Tax=Granulicella cerasi TaxID=741063 RepID=A0ABW1Z8F1_9BACT|nr:RsmD family RNA methyltransferase [Granulicella cerasi]